MRIFIQPFDHFGEEPSILPPEWYYRQFAKISHIKEFINSGIWHKPFTVERYKELCASYSGSYGDTCGICVKPGGVLELEYTMFHTIADRGDRRYNDRCRLKIWLDKKDVFKVMGIK